MFKKSVSFLADCLLILYIVACGTCKVNVIRGDIDHQDVYLNATERAKNNVMMTCISRSLSNRLILDI